VCDLETSRMGASYIYDISRLRVKVSGQCDVVWSFGYWSDPPQMCSSKSSWLL